MWHDDPILFAVLVVACLISLLALLVCEKRKSRRGRAIAKPLASSAFVALAFSLGALESPYGRTMLGAFLFSWLGDILLIPESTLWFRLGLFSFLIGHLG